MKVRIRRLPAARDLPLPAYASPGSAGFDLRAAVDGEVVLRPGERLLVPTGLALEIPPGWEGRSAHGAASPCATASGSSTPRAPSTATTAARWG